MITRLFTLALLAPIAVTGCETLRGLTGGGERIDDLFLLSSPAALNFDGRPGSDGFPIQMYAYQRENPKGVLITSGEVKIELYDGRGVEEGAEPLSSWSYTPDRLEAQQMRTTFGAGYYFVVRWEREEPPRGDVTVIVRYDDGDGRTIASAPMTIAVDVKRASGTEG